MGEKINLRSQRISTWPNVGIVQPMLGVIVSTHSSIKSRYTFDK